MGYVVLECLCDSVFEFGSAVVVEQLYKLGGDTRERGAAVRGLLQ